MKKKVLLQSLNKFELLISPFSGQHGNKKRHQKLKTQMELQKKKEPFSIIESQHGEIFTLKS